MPDHGVGFHVADDHGTGGDNGTLAHAAALQDHGVGPDDHVILDDDGHGAGRLDDPGQDRPGPDVAVLAHDGPAAQHGAHVDHGPGPDDRADVDDGTHHDDGVVANLHLVSNDGAGLDAGVNALLVEHRHAGIAAVVLDHHVLDGASGGVEHRLEERPVTKNDLVLVRAKDVVSAGKVDGGTLLQTDIDLDRGVLKIQRAISRQNGKVVEAPLKTKNAYRTLPLSADAISVLKMQKCKVGNSEWVFPSPTGGPMSPDSVLHMLHRVLKRAGLPKVRFHDLRHTFATLALQNGVDIKTVSGMLGHFSAGFTLDTYAHVTTSAKREAAKTMGSILSGAV